MKELPVLAQLKIKPSDIGYDIGKTATGDGTLMNILNLVYTWAGIVAVIILIIAGFIYVTSRGDATQMKRSKDAIRGTIIGLIVVMTAFIITRFIIGGTQG